MRGAFLAPVVTASLPAAIPPFAMSTPRLPASTPPDHQPLTVEPRPLAAVFVASTALATGCAAVPAACVAAEPAACVAALPAAAEPEPTPFAAVSSMLIVAAARASPAA